MCHRHTYFFDIVYDKDSFQIHYVRSEDLNYKVRDGEELIHPNCNAWVRNLTADIDGTLSQERVSTAKRSAR